MNVDKCWPNELGHFTHYQCGGAGPCVESGWRTVWNRGDQSGTGQIYSADPGANPQMSPNSDQGIFRSRASFGGYFVALLQSPEPFGRLERSARTLFGSQSSKAEHGV